ncbi:RluA family pseudouridine synthase [Entomoplasma freundtii]|uniref:Pseudouridine synthase n=1 Tax=Entomoplasma freundtii TaxID=74700 RepID=A0A2K8NSH6_9MOLU|nr:RluA family pseudouridine synthase [Entomoplasma freundtii]ATZ16506.1 23S rRNA pseudouridine1911/1915/1917 synthase [Entomoplasma freundtii]TDY56036.1 RluA family pseudouridine synthase [Entomoplasma freundtii]
METREIFIVEEDESRLDKYLSRVLKETFDLSRTMVQHLIAEGQVRVNGVTTTIAKLALKKGDDVEISIPAPKSSELKAQPIPLDILFQDDYLLVLNKQNNLPVHPGAGHPENTLVNGLLYSIPNLSGIGGIERPGIVHRLDKQTTGAILIAKTDQAHRRLSEMMANREIYKEYWGLVCGLINEEKGRIEAPIGRHPNDRKKMAVTSKNGKSAITKFEVLERYENEELTLVSVILETGRTHQIRVHFDFIGHPILNDPVYGQRKPEATDFGQYLHAHKLVFRHPITDERMEFTAPLPQEFTNKIQTLRLERG